MSGRYAASAVKGKFEGWLVNKRGQRLYCVKYEPPSARPIARLFFHHGLAEHVSRYDQVFARMSQNGIAIHSFDAHGHGKSEPQAPAERALVWQFKHLVDDFNQVLDTVVEETKGDTQTSKQAVPMFLGGQSMGGLVAAHVALDPRIPWSGLLLHSPALDVEWTPMLRVQAKVGGLMAMLIPKARIVPAVRPEDMSQDPAVVQDYLSDPLNTVGNACARTGNELLMAFKQLATRDKEIKIPVYVGHGSNDRCTSLPASRRFVKSVSSQDATLNEFPGGFHELLHGPEWEDAADRMVQWIAQRSGSGQSKL